MSYLFKSERLGFRNWLDTDLEPFAKMNQDPDVMEFFPTPLTTEDSNTLVERMKVQFDATGYTFYAVDTLHNQEFIGFIGVVDSKFDAFFTPCFEIGWRLKKSSWGVGYGTEGAIACMKYCFETFNMNAIHSITSTINPKSEKIMQKIGMVKIGEFDHPKLEKGSRLEQHVVYEWSNPNNTID